MAKLSRRDLIATLAASAGLLATKANANCDVWRDAVGSTRTKSYQCKVNGGQTLTSTFLRVSDVMFDSAGGALLPGELGEVQSLVQGHTLIETPALETFIDLFERHSIPFESNSIYLEYDLRDGRGENWLTSDSVGGVDASRWRTLGTWNELHVDEDLPAFPIPDLLRQAIRNYATDNTGNNGSLGLFKYADREDFRDLDQRKQEYVDLWRRSIDFDYPTYDFRQLDLLDDLDAGSVDGFLPIIFSPNLYGVGCGSAAFGAHYIPPALYVDLMVCRNDGTEVVEVEDLFGSVDLTSRLRAYDPTTPPGAERFGLAPLTLAPGESFLVVQRLLFRARSSSTYVGPEPIVQQPAIYGATHLPKGVVVGGEAIAFEGRSHNALVLASYAGENSCPYLESWCPNAQEWIEHGKILTENDSPGKAGSDTRSFRDVRSRFRLSEREHEDTFLTGAILEVSFANGANKNFTHPEATLNLSLGETVEIEFELPAEVMSQAIRSSLTLTGYYQKFGAERVEALATTLCA